MKDILAETIKTLNKILGKHKGKDVVLKKGKYGLYLKLNETISMTANWYKNYYQKKNKQDIYEFSIKQINEYVSLASKKGIEWSI